MHVWRAVTKWGELITVQRRQRFCMMRLRYSSDIRYGVGAGCNASPFVFSRAGTHQGSAKKINKLAKTRVPTGDTSIPEDVHEIKAIREIIIKKTDGVMGSEDEIFSPDDIEDDVEDRNFEDQLALEREERQIQNNTPNNTQQDGVSVTQGVMSYVNYLLNFFIG